MTEGRRKAVLRLGWFLSLSLLAACSGSGGGSPTAPPPDESPAIAAEGLSAAASTTAIAVPRKTLAIAPSVAALGTYDPTTDTWTVSINLDTGATAELRIQFRTATGGRQQFYNPVTTASIHVAGSASGPNGTVTFDFTLDGTQAAVGALVVNGSGTASGANGTASYTVANLVLPKNLAYPTSGTIVVVSGAITVTVRFDGTHLAQGTYTFLAVTKHFTIDLDTGQVTRG